MAYGIGGFLVSSLAAIDQVLESFKVLPVLQAQLEAPDVMDPETGQIKGEYRQVSGCACACACIELIQPMEL